MNQNKKDKLILPSRFIFIMFFIFLFSFTFISASSFGYNEIEQGFKTINQNTSVSNNTYYINGSNINATSTTCSGTDKFSAYNNATGVFTCTADITSAGGNVLIGDGNYTYNDTTYIHFNSTLAGTNLSVNSSNWWDSYNTANTSQISNVGGVLTIITSYLSTAFNSFFGAKTTDDLTQGSSNLYDNQSWNFSKYWTNASGTFSQSALTETDPQWTGNQTAVYNESKWTGNFTAYNVSWTSTFNSTYNSLNSTGFIKDWNASLFIKDWNATGWIINWSQVIGSNFVSLSQLLGFNYFNETTKNITNNSYYLVANPYGYLNTTINTSYYLATNPFAFYNVTTIGNLPNTNNYWNTTFANFNKTYADTLYASISVVDTNETSRFNNLTAIDCGGTNKQIGVQENGTILCSADLTGTGITWAEATNGTLVSLTTLLGFNYFNSTWFGGIGNWSNDKGNYSTYSNDTSTFKLISEYNSNYSANDANYRSITNTSYVNYDNVSNLNVNGSSWWDSYNTANSTHFSNSGGVLTLVISFLQGLFVDTTGDTMTGNLNMSLNNITLTNSSNGGARICLSQDCTSYIRNNGTGVVIKG